MLFTFSVKQILFSNFIHCNSGYVLQRFYTLNNYANTSQATEQIATFEMNTSKKQVSSLSTLDISPTVLQPGNQYIITNHSRHLFPVVPRSTYSESHCITLHKENQLDTTSTSSKQQHHMGCLFKAVQDHLKYA